MIPLYVCTECGSEARVPHVGQELNGVAKVVRCIMCGAAMSQAGPWGRPAYLLRAQAAANRAAVAAAAVTSPPGASEKTQGPNPEPDRDGSKPRRARRIRRVGPKIRRTRRQGPAKPGSSNA